MTEVELPAWLTPHTVTLRLKTGNGVKGPTYASSSTTRAAVEDKAHMVRDDTGTQVPSSSTVTMPLAAATRIPPGSLVTVAGDTRPREVIIAARYQHSGPTPNHWEVHLR